MSKRSQTARKPAPPPLSYPQLAPPLRAFAPTPAAVRPSPYDTRSLPTPTIFGPGEIESDPIQRTAESWGLNQESGGAEFRPDVPVAFGGGSALPASVQAQMESSFNNSFADVRIHAGAEAAQVGALAYTRGEDIHFQPGRYDPHSLGGQELLGHELTHVVQQRAGRVQTPQSKPDGGAPINADTGLEAEADRMGTLAARGRPAAVAGAGQGIQRKAEDAPIQRYTLGGPVEDNGKKLATETDEEYRLRRLNTAASGMAALRQTMADKDADPSKRAATDMADNSPALAKLQLGQRAAREMELDTLRNGTLKGGRELETSEADGLGVRTKTVTPLETTKPVRQGATTGASDFNGAWQVTPPTGVQDTKIKTLTGGKAGALETSLNNPISTPQRPRDGMAERHEKTLAAANEADALMGSLDTTGSLPANYVRSPDAYTNSGNAKAGYAKVQDGSLFHNPSTATDDPVNWLKTTGGDAAHIIGMDEFQNRSTRMGGVEKSLPTLDPSNAHADYTGGVAATKKSYLSTHAKENKPGVWGEADLDHDPHTPGAVMDVSARGRGTNRLHYTDPTSVDTATGSPVNFNYAVTTDHYESAIPITPVKKDYAKNNPYTITKGNSLNSYSAKQEELQRGQTRELAKDAREQREELEETRTQADLKSLAPQLTSKAMMYGTSEKSMAPLELERQHQDVQSALSGSVPSPKPMSDEAMDMYG